MSWYNQGFSAVREENQRRDIERAADVDRFYLKQGDTCSLVFIDDEPFTINEHTVYRRGSKDKDPLTCMSKVHPDDPVCCTRLGPKTAGLTGFLTVLDGTKYPSKRDPNKYYQYGLKLFPGKGIALSVLDRKKTDRTTLTYTKCKVTRDGDKTPQVGNEFEFGEVITDPTKVFAVAEYKGKKLSDLFDQAERDPAAMTKLAYIFRLAKSEDGKLVRRIPPFNYMNLLKPRTPDQVRLFLAGDVTGSYDDSKSGKFNGGGGSSKPGSEDAPF